MCGIFGYIGRKEVLPFLIEGLKKLEYRGYDSAGAAALDAGKITTLKCKGKIADLEKKLEGKKLAGKIGLGHTRWATHGEPSDENSHPHLDCSGKIAVVHNGIIENYQEIRQKLIEEGHQFVSTCDTEIIPHLIEKHYQELKNLEGAVRKALNELEGSYAIGIISEFEPDKIFAARKGSPLIIGVKEDENFLASDIVALIKHTPRVIYLENNDLAILTENTINISDLDGTGKEREIKFVSWDPESAEKEGYSHFMLKEIHEQPQAIRQTIGRRIEGGIQFVELDKEELPIDRIIFTACGTSWHAGLVGEYMAEQILRIPCEVEYAAEFRYRNPVLDRKTLVIAISQSGETADTLAAAEEVKKSEAKLISICNVVGSSLARDSDRVIYTYAGPEIGVASTKAFTTQLSVIYLLVLYLAKIRGILSPPEIKEKIQDLTEIPDKIEEILSSEKEIQAVAENFYQSSNAIFLGRGEGFPIALEGALKLKEISYIHAEGYPAAEMKHGPIALIDRKMLVVVLAFQGRRYKKILGNIEEVKARGGQVIAIASLGDQTIHEKADKVIYVPKTSEILSPILAVVPLQLLAYYIALKKSCQIDQPRNLAKSVTVE